MKKYRLPVLIVAVHVLLILVAIPWLVRFGIAGNTAINWEFAIALSVAILVGIDMWLLRRNKIPNGALALGQIFLALGTMIATIGLLGLVLPNSVGYRIDTSGYAGVLLTFGMCGTFVYFIMFKLWENKT